MLNDLKIAISGKSGCGNTSVTKIVSQTLGLQHINYTFRDMARERNISFQEMHDLAENDTRYDLFLDNMLVMLAARGKCVLGSRLAVWLLKDAHLKVYLTASVEVRSGRIAQREGIPFGKALEDTVARDKRDRKRYLELYGIDIDSFDFVDLLIDTEKNNQQEVADRIIMAARAL